MFNLEVPLNLTHFIIDRQLNDGREWLSHKLELVFTVTSKANKIFH